MIEDRMFGVVCAAITPMTDSEQIDYDSVKPFVEYLQEIGCDGLYPIGTTGESMVIEPEERTKLAHAFAKANAGKTPLFLQCGDWNAHRVMENIKVAQDIGATGVGVMLPAFFPCDDRAVEEYFSRILSAFPDYPIYLYNIPRNAANDLSVSVYERLLKTFPNCVGVKYSSSDMQRLQDYQRVGAPYGAGIMTGSEYMYFGSMALGACGCISGTCPAFPEAFMGLYPKFMSGDLEGARAHQALILETKRLIAGIPVVPFVKAILKKKGIIKSDACRSPIRRLTAQEYGKLDDIMTAYEALL